jgi:hypothetical protein
MGLKYRIHTWMAIVSSTSWLHIRPIRLEEEAQKRAEGRPAANNTETLSCNLHKVKQSVLAVAGKTGSIIIPRYSTSTLVVGRVPILVVYA